MSSRTLTPDEVVGELRDGMTIGIGGWGSRRKPMALVRAILRSGLTDLTIRIYPAARHEILNETNRAEVITALNSWLDRVVASSGQDD